MSDGYTPAQIERALRSRAQAIHVAVNRWVTARKTEPVGAWKDRRDMAVLLNRAAYMLGSSEKDASNWKTTATVVLRKYNDLIQGINAEPHADSCPAYSKPGKAECDCWKKRVHEFEAGKLVL